MKSTSPQVQTYALSGGGKVTVYKPFNATSYFAIVEQDGMYPEAGHLAVNKGRREYSVILDGTFVYEVKGKSIPLSKGEQLLVGEGQPYRITGKGRVMVFVEDEEGGATLIQSE
jgi:hypothetical protein